MLQAPTVGFQKRPIGHQFLDILGIGLKRHLEAC